MRAPTSTLLAASDAASMPPIDFQANATRFGQLLANGRPFFLKGTRWGGTEEKLMVPRGLDRHSLDHYLALLYARGLKLYTRLQHSCACRARVDPCVYLWMVSVRAAASLRVSMPFAFHSTTVCTRPQPSMRLPRRSSLPGPRPRATCAHITDRMLKNEIVGESDALAFAPELTSLPYVHLFVALAKAAARRGLLVVLACDRLRADITPDHHEAGTWYSATLPEELALRSWQRVAHSLCPLSNVIGADLFEAPYKASWGLDDPRTDWNSAAERLGNRVLELCPRWLVFVQGVGEEPGAGEGQDTAGGSFRGENIYGARGHPVSLLGATWHALSS